MLGYARDKTWLGHRLGLFQPRRNIPSSGHLILSVDYEDQIAHFERFLIVEPFQPLHWLVVGGYSFVHLYHIRSARNIDRLHTFRNVSAAASDPPSTFRSAPDTVPRRKWLDVSA